MHCIVQICIVNTYLSKTGSKVQKNGSSLLKELLSHETNTEVH